MNRRTNSGRWLLAAAIAWTAALGAALAARDVPAQQPELPKPVTPSDPRNLAGRQVSLRDQLRVGLKAVTKGDFEFIDLVVLRVDQGVLPRRLVDGTFLWARRRVVTRNKQYFNRPMVYFQPALVQQARAIGVVL